MWTSQYWEQFQSAHPRFPGDGSLVSQNGDTGKGPPKNSEVGLSWLFIAKLGFEWLILVDKYAVGWKYKYKPIFNAWGDPSVKYGNG